MPVREKVTNVRFCSLTFPTLMSSTKFAHIMLRAPHVPRAFASFPQLQRDVGPVHIDQVLVVHLQHQGGDLGEPAGKQVLDKVPCEQFHFVHLQNFIVCHGKKYT